MLERGRDFLLVVAGFGYGLRFVHGEQPTVAHDHAAGKIRAISLAPEPMVRRLGLIYRKDKALSKAALGFIQVVLDNVGDDVSDADKKPRVLAR